MAKNEVFAPGVASDKLSLPVSGAVASGDPVKVGGFVGVAQTAKEASDGAATGVVNSNAPGNVTVWISGIYRLPVDVTGTADIGDPVYAVVTGTDSKVALTNVAASGDFLFGHLYEASAAGSDLPLAVRVVGTTGDALVVA